MQRSENAPAVMPGGDAGVDKSYEPVEDQGAEEKIGGDFVVY